MGIFGTPRTSGDQSEPAEIKPAEDDFEFGERKETVGPLPIVDSLVDTVVWLEKARKKVSEGGNTCCLVVCTPNPIAGAAMELTVEEIGNRFANSLRSYDAMFRHGRDKFLIALPHVKPSDATAVLERLRGIIGNTPFKLPDNGLDIFVSVSLGAVMMDSNPVQELINRADKAMEMGRINRTGTCIWTADMAV